MLNKREIRMILELLAKKVVVPSNKDFPYEITTRSHGYSEDPHIGALQAKLSMMLEATQRE